MSDVEDDDAQLQGRVKLAWGQQVDVARAKRKEIPKTKLQAFAAPVLKKTAFQKQKEEAEARKKKENEEAARVYEEFVASFDDDGSAPKAFVRAGTMNPKSIYDAEEAAGGKNTAGRGSIYVPMTFVKAGAPKAPPPEKKRDEESRPEPKEDKSKKKRNMDAFLEELMREQEQREDRLRRKMPRTDGDGEPARSVIYDDRGGSFDTGDPNTTNLYVGNINPQVNEDTLCRQFGVYGPIASVKIMWPRTQEERDRNRNCGFIAFMSRSDAAAALKDMDGFDLQGYAMRVGWGKAVPIPENPIFTLDKARPPPSGLPFNAISTGSSKSAGAFSAVPPPDSGPIRSSEGPRLEVRVTRPVDFEVVRRIHHVVERVLKYGADFEMLLREREKDNPDFAFLFMHDHPDHVYYRWRLYAFLQGDTTRSWRTEPFHMFDHGPVWLPPEEPCDDEDYVVDLDASEDENERLLVPKGALGKRARDRLEHMLGKTTARRGDIARIMAFAFDHLDAAEEVIEVIVKSLLIAETPTATKVARLYLLSDILHNSSMPIPNAWKYRAGFECRLPEIFEHFNQVYRGIESRLKAEQFRRQVANVLSVWANWIVFAQAYIDSLGAIFARRNKSPSPPPAQAPALPQEQQPRPFDFPGQNAFAAQGVEVDEEETRGARLRRSQVQCAGEEGEEDIDGVPINFANRAPAGSGGVGVEEEEEEEEDIDGVPLVHPDVASAADEDDDDDMFA